MNNSTATAASWFRIVALAVLVLAPSCAQTLATIASLGGANGENPEFDWSLVQGPDGSLYGTTLHGGTSEYGTVFKVTTAGVITTLHNFTGLRSGPSGPDGGTPDAGLILATDGNFYGTTVYGGANGLGTVFKMTPTGLVTVIHSFTGGSDSQSPKFGLVQAIDGNLYGEAGGAFGGPEIIFSITTSGTFTKLVDFSKTSPSGFVGLIGGLIAGLDGSLYGITEGGGDVGVGVVFRLSLGPNPVLTTIHTFNCEDGGDPLSLMQAKDGTLYGTTLVSPLNGDCSGGGGEIFSITPSGSFSLFNNFNDSPGEGDANSRLIQATDGNLYGTLQDGAHNSGAIYQITPGGTFKTVYDFPAYGTNGGGPNGLVQAANGIIYGTTSYGGQYQNGTVFSVTLPTPTSFPPAISTGGIVPVGGKNPIIQSGEWVSIYGTNLATGTATWNGEFPTTLGGTSVTIDGKPAYLWYLSPSQINIQVPNDTATGTVPVVITTQSGSATSSVTLAQFAPVLSLLDTKHVAGLIIGADGAYSIIGPTGNSFGYPTVAAKAGDSVVLFGLGFGPTSPAVLAGQAYSGAAAATSPVTMLINNVSVPLAFAGLSSAGLYQFNLTIPPGLGTGDVPLQAIVGGVQTQSGVVISLQ